MVQAKAAFDWVAIAGADREVQEQTSRDTLALARMLALQDLVQDRDGAVAELPRRMRDVAKEIWPDSSAPLTGFGLHASPASFLIARFAVGLVPVGRSSLRHEPLRPETVANHLREFGVDDVTAMLLVRSWAGVSEGETGDAAGLSPSMLAGMAERTLTPSELERALVQIAWSPRCLERLGATLGLASSVRRLMTLLPPESLGPELAVGVAGMALGRPDRVVELLRGAASSLGPLTFFELARSQWELVQAQAPTFSSEPDELVRLPVEGDANTDAPGRADTDTPPPAEESLPVRPVCWACPGGAPAEAVRAWCAARDSLEAGASPGAFLGLVPAPLVPTVRPVPIPPDARTLVKDWGHDPSAEVERSPSPRRSHRPDEPLYPAVRGALRLIASAAEGRVPSAVAVEEAGDLVWVVQRARALGLLVQGEPGRAAEAAGSLSPEEAPERRWADDLLVRYGARAPAPVGPEESRPAAAALVADLAHQLSRTLAGTVPTDG